MKYKTNERSILFTDKMVNAVLENRKTITRRLVKPKPSNFIDHFEYGCVYPVGNSTKKGTEYGHGFKSYMMPGEPSDHPIVKAKYRPGLHLWVRETWGVRAYSNESAFEISVLFRADNFEKYHIDLDNEELWRRIVAIEEKPVKLNRIDIKNWVIWRSPFFMPRIVSRINLKILDVKINRLHEVDDTEARLEGCKDREDFIKAWDSINKKSGYPWKANPWVYRVCFERID